MTQPLEIGLIAPLPPQVGGVASFAQWLLDHEGEIGCRFRPFELRRPPGEEEGGRLRIGSVLRQGPQLIRFLRWLRGAPTTVHYCVSMTRTGLPRDLVFVALLRATGRNVIAHNHGPMGKAGGEPPFLLRALGRLSKRRVAVVSLEGWEFFPNPLRFEAQARPHQRATPGIRLLAVGLFGLRKGSDVLLDSLAIVRGDGVAADLRFVGRELRRNDERALRRRVLELGLDDAVQFAGTLPADRLSKEYREADVFCLPSRREGLPMALLEAMAFGLPVITTPVGAIPAVIEDGETGILVEPGDVHELTEAIQQLAADTSLRERLGTAGAAHVQAICAPQRVAERWQGLYRSLAR